MADAFYSAKKHRSSFQLLPVSHAIMKPPTSTKVVFQHWPLTFALSIPGVSGWMQSIQTLQASVAATTQLLQTYEETVRQAEQEADELNTEAQLLEA